MTREKMVYRKFGFDRATLARLRAKAKAHKVSQAAFVRAMINGHRAGGDPGTDAAIADAWWDSKSPKRRVSVARNHAPSLFTSTAGDPQQLTIFDPTQQGEAS